MKYRPSTITQTKKQHPKLRVYAVIDWAGLDFRVVKVFRSKQLAFSCAIGLQEKTKKVATDPHIQRYSVLEFKVADTKEISINERLSFLRG